jgi:anti-sigma B factor antagonist
MQLEIETTVERGRVIVTPRGDVDLVSQAQLKEHLIDLIVEGHVDLVVDLTETTFLDSTGLGTLIGARRRIHALKGTFALVCPHERMLKLFRITSLDKIFAIHPDRAAALGTPDADPVPETLPA